MRNNKQLPLLLTSHGEAYEKQSLYSLIKNRYQTTCLDVLSGKRILSSAHGWLVLADTDTDDCCLWNPAESIQLPRLHQSYLYSSCVLSKPPTELGCLLMFNSSSTMDQSFCRIGDDKFVNVSLTERECGLMAISSFRGEIYGIIDAICHYEIVTIHLVGETIELRPLLIDGERPWKAPQQIRRWVRWDDHYLIESPCGADELLLVTKMVPESSLNDGVKFRVFRVNVNEMVCVELENIDGLTIFISHCGNGFCCLSSSETGSRPNSIYYTNERGRVMCVYDLDDKSTTVLLPCPVADRYMSINYWVDLPEILDS